ncbi:MAG: MarR family transcriptional regulator [Deltaproteobacteria bacterium]|nr:MarR family transcriptional regulator [Deltaproteobacteria bacterium]
MPTLSTEAQIAQRLILLMNTLHSRYAGDCLDLMVEYNITLPQIMALHAMRAGAGNVTQLAQALGITTSNASQLLHKLFEREMVSRYENPQDRRQKVIFPAREADELLDRLAQARSEQIARAIEGIDPALRDEFVAVLDRVIAQLQPVGASR